MVPAQRKDKVNNTWSTEKIPNSERRANGRNREARVQRTSRKAATSNSLTQMEKRKFSMEGRNACESKK